MVSAEADFTSSSFSSAVRRRNVSNSAIRRRYSFLRSASLASASAILASVSAALASASAAFFSADSTCSFSSSTSFRTFDRSLLSLSFFFFSAMVLSIHVKRGLAGTPVKPRQR